MDPLALLDMALERGIQGSRGLSSSVLLLEWVPRGQVAVMSCLVSDHSLYPIQGFTDRLKIVYGIRYVIANDRWSDTQDHEIE